MSTELKMLAYTVLLGIAQLVAAATMSTVQRGLKWNMSARDTKAAELIGRAGRIDRAFRNLLETFPFFLAAVVFVQAGNLNNSHTALGAELYFFARLIYFPIYIMGLPGIRTAVWFAGVAGILVMLFTAF